MTTERPPDPALLQQIRDMLVARGMIPQKEADALVTGDRCRMIASDGSTRRFWRLERDGRPLCLVAAPAGTSPAELAESRSAWHIGNHLLRHGVPVPALYGWNDHSGVLLFEDLGDTRLHDIVTRRHGDVSGADSTLRDWYHAVLDQLAAMQIRGAEGFDPAWCWDTPRYDEQLMVARESEYFLSAFWQGLLGKDSPTGIVEELRDIARLAGEAPADYFLHRDFQSRNIMVKEEAIRFIDYQGGRFGPLGYDLASLLIDPYCALPREFQDELVEYYQKVISRYIDIGPSLFRRQYSLLALQRNLQIVGAFSFLYKIRQKPFFMDFIAPSLASLNLRLQDPLFQQYPLLRNVVGKGAGELAALS